MSILLAAFAVPATWAFAETNTSAQTIGIGNIYGFDTRSSAIFANPASMHTAKISVDSFQTSYLNSDYSQLVLSGAMPLWNDIQIGAGINGTQIPGILSTRLNGSNEIEESSTFTFSDLDYRVGIAMPFDKNTRIGGSVLYRNKQFGSYGGNGFGMDLGVMRTMSNWELSATLKNIGYKLRYTDGATEQLPMDAVIGGAYQPPELKGITLYAQGTFEEHAAFAKAFGLSYSPDKFRILVLRLGWREVWATSHLVSSFTGGASLDLGRVGFHYAFEPSTYTEQSMQHYFSISTLF